MRLLDENAFDGFLLFIQIDEQQCPKSISMFAIVVAVAVAVILINPLWSVVTLSLTHSLME